MLFKFDIQTVKLIKEIHDFVLENNKFKNLINLFPLPVFYKDEDGLYIDCNIAFTHYVKLSKEQIIGKKIDDLVPAYIVNVEQKSEYKLEDKTEPIIIYELRSNAHNNKLSIFEQSFCNEKTGTYYTVGFGLDKEISYNKMSEMTLQKKIEEYNKQLINYAIKLESSTNFLNQLKSNIHNSGRKNIVGKKILYDIELSIDHFLKNEFWISPLTHQLRNTAPDFYIILKEKYPKLSTLDMKICALVKMQISTKEIAVILSVNTASVEQSLYRIRQKMGVKGKGILQKILLDL